MFKTHKSSAFDDSNNLLDPQKLVEPDHLPVKICMVSLVGVMIVLGNVVVLLVIASSASGWSRNSRCFLLSLTGANCAFGLVVMPLNVWVSLLKDYSDGPDALCHVVAYCNATVYATCIYTLATISLERYVAVVYPLTYSSLVTRKRALLLIAFAWCFPPCLLLPISIPDGIIEVRFSTASLVCSPAYATNVGYSLTLSCSIFLPCAIIMMYSNLRLWCAAKRQRLKLRKYDPRRRSPPDRAFRVLVPAMAVYYTCWTPYMASMIYSAVSGSSVPEWMEFVVVWLPTSNGFFNCIFYFWINRSFRRKFRFLFQKLCLALCPGLARALGWPANPQMQFVSEMGDNTNSGHQRSTSVSSTCTLLTLTEDTPI